MADRDPNRAQLEFPQLVADLITQLRLTGQVGRLNFSDEVVPTFLIGSRGINFGGDLPAFTSASLTTGVVDVPVAESLVVDTGALPAGTYDVMANITAQGTIGVGLGATFMQHRNAANNATLADFATLLITTVDHSSQVVVPLIGYVIGLDERIRIISPNALMTNGGISATLFVQLRPTP